MDNSQYNNLMCDDNANRSCSFQISAVIYIYIYIYIERERACQIIRLDIITIPCYYLGILLSSIMIFLNYLLLAILKHSKLDLGETLDFCCHDYSPVESFLCYIHSLSSSVPRPIHI